MKIYMMLMVIWSMLVAGCTPEDAKYAREQGSEDDISMSHEKDETPAIVSAAEFGPSLVDAGLSEYDESTLRSWRSARAATGVEGAEEVARICLRAGLSHAQILSMLGNPNPHVHSHDNSLAYNYMPSQLLIFYFDEDEIARKAWVNGQTITLEDE